MNQIKCPNCGEVFTIDESSYESIVNQIKNETFEKELAIRENAAKEKYSAELNLLKEKLANENKASLLDKDNAIQELKHRQEMLESEFETRLAKELAKKESERQELATKANDAVSKLKAEIESLKTKVESIKIEEKAKTEKAVAEVELKLSENINESKIKINELKNKLDAKETESALMVERAVNELKDKKDSEIQGIKNELENLKVESKTKEESLISNYEERLSSKDKELAAKQELVDYYKDFKAKQSTKMIGESLEQHCSYEFNRNRMGMFPKAYFEKDNDTRTGSKGDFIFKDFDEDGTEIVSIMFEMKNEADTTSTKHKNEDFFKELDKDRNEKGCEYAILVSLLEQDNELYNEGIVDVSYKYPKMYVIRPQFFLPIITLLRNAALNSLSYKRQLIVERNNNLDITHFEENMNTFKDAFSKNYETAAKKFNTAIEEIDKTIDHLQKTKDALLSSENQLRLANNKAQDLSIKKLTKGAPSVALKFEEERRKKG